MKKRLFALLLAGLMTASMAACVTTRGNQNTGGENTFTPPTTSTTKKDEPGIPQPNQWKEVDKTLYTFEAVAMYSDAKVSSAKVVDLPKEAELHCTLQNTYWSYVSYQDGTETRQGYVSNASLTNVDLLAKGFTPVSGGEKTMYVKEKAQTVRIRLYPCTDTFSTIKGSLSWNEAVTVVSENGEWSRIKVTEGGVTNYYFVASEYLAAEKQIDWNDASQWENLFTDCAPLTKYVNLATVHLRKAPNLQSDSEEILTQDMEVTVKKTAQIDGSSWSYIEVWMPEKKVGDGPYLAKGYIKSALLSDKPTSAPATLDEVLARYPGAFEALDAPKTMYAIIGTTNVRSTPLFPDTEAGEKDNVVETLKTADEVKVVAAGAYEGTSFYIIEYTVDEKLGFYFVATKGLTTDPTGKPTVTLDDLTERYPNFEVCTETAAVTKSTANCYLKPDNSAQNPDLQLAAGTAVTIVARSTADQWCVIRAENGTLYFVNSLLLEEAAN